MEHIRGGDIAVRRNGVSNEVRSGFEPVMPHLEIEPRWLEHGLPLRVPCVRVVDAERHDEPLRVALVARVPRVIQERVAVHVQKGRERELRVEHHRLDALGRDRDAEVVAVDPEEEVVPEKRDSLLIYGRNGCATYGRKGVEEGNKKYP